MYVLSKHTNYITEQRLLNPIYEHITLRLRIAKVGM